MTHTINITDQGNFGLLWLQTVSLSQQMPRLPKERSVSIELSESIKRLDFNSQELQRSRGSSSKGILLNHLSVIESLSAAAEDRG